MDSLCQTVLSVFKFLSEFARYVGKYNVNQTIFAFDKTDQIFLSGQYRSIYIVSDWYLSKIFEVERKPLMENYAVFFKRQCDSHHIVSWSEFV